MGRCATIDGLYGLLGVLCNVWFCGTFQGVRKQIRVSMDNPPPKNTMTPMQDPPEVIQVPVMSLPLRNDLHPWNV